MPIAHRKLPERTGKPPRAQFIRFTYITHLAEAIVVNYLSPLPHAAIRLHYSGSATDGRTLGRRGEPRPPYGRGPAGRSRLATAV